ncbi:TIM-barrel domain-containing protein [Fulvimonas soli]|uniref:Beta-galactosidase-like protein n=1 Tax=Fulvimonas soli TaxID=155197 RepID=A0A316IYV9_9GAMM|nr:TIM-barrel domain-containing protein [Fulvimonas soli]PWK92435.1 beta-galactosidase-like protein [Fulvimonas soli]
MAVHRWAMKGVLAALLPLGLACCALAPDKPVVTADHARFEFLTPTLVRMEYAPSGRFVDAPTAVVQKRDWPAVAVRTERRDGWLVARTEAMTLRYRLGSGPFAAGNLKVTWNGGGAQGWHPGQEDPRNLGGLTYSLDNISQPNLPTDGLDLDSPVNDVIPGIEVKLEKAKPGLLSRSGYAFIDDSRTPLWNARAQWIEPRAEQGGQDWYLFAYGRDYPRVLREYARLCGPVPMIPRYTLGPWITDFNFEYFPGTAQARQPAFRRYDQRMLEDELARLRADGIPFDTLVLDFAWHNYGWDGGYDWSPLVPQPDAFIRWLHARGIKLALNDHPGYANTRESILSHDDSHAPAVLRALGRPPPPRPAFELDVTAARWRFAADPRDRGLAGHWYAPGHDDRRWAPIRAGASWQEQGHAGQGVAWYRAEVTLPERLPAKLYLQFGEVAKDYRLFVNGQEVEHSRVQWPQHVTYADVAAYARPGRRNAIALRVEPGPRGGGLLRGPVAFRDAPPPERIAFDLADRHQADVFMRELHRPLMRQGVDLWWVDGGGGAADMPGLDPQLWTNKVFYDFAQGTGRRGFILSRYGDWGSERYPAFFTGDTYSEWPVLAYEVAYTARAGNVLVPYVSHDIGGFHGGRIDFELYARWIEFGAFSPILRMHSAHANPREGNLRMPWVYGDRGVALMRKYFALRTRLIPYLYSHAWTAHETSLPLLRPLYLTYPDLEEAYRQTHEYLLGDELLVAPVLAPGGERTVYLPPGRWIGFFDGRRYAGGASFTRRYAVDETPVFAREGAVVPSQPDSAYSDQRPLDTLVLDVYGDGADDFRLYEDDGVSADYDAPDRHAITPIRHATRADGSHELAVGPAQGRFAGQVQQRAYVLRVHAQARPSWLTVDGRPAAAAWQWDARTGVATARLPAHPVGERLDVAWR